MLYDENDDTINVILCLLVFFCLMVLVVLRGLIWADNEERSPFD